MQNDYEEARLVIGPIICEPPPLDQFQKLSVEYRLNAIEESKEGEEEIICPRVNVTENSFADLGASYSGIYEISDDKVSWFKIILCTKDRKGRNNSERCIDRFLFKKK